MTHPKRWRDKVLPGDVLVALVILAVVGILIRQGIKQDRPPTAIAAQQPDCGSPFAAFSAAKQFVQQSLKAPTTAQFADFRASKIVNVEGVCGLWSVTSYVDAQNGFGAMIRTYFIAEMSGYTTGKWTLNNLRTAASPTELGT